MASQDDDLIPPGEAAPVRTLAVVPAQPEPLPDEIAQATAVIAAPAAPPVTVEQPSAQPVEPRPAVPAAAQAVIAQAAPAVQVNAPMELDEHAVAAQANLAEDVKYPTGVDLPPELHARVLAAAAKLTKGDNKVRQTEIFLKAFEAATEEDDLDEILAEARKPQTVKSKLFGTRAIQQSTGQTPKQRLQIRPTFGQYTAAVGLATSRRMKFALLARIVLNWYLPAPQSAAKARKATPPVAQQEESQS